MAILTKWRDCSPVIANGQTVSDELNLSAFGARRVKYLQITGPGTLPETVTVQVGDGIGGTYAALSSGGSDFTIPAGKTVSLPAIVAKSLRLVAGAPVGGDRTFRVQGAAVVGV